MKSKMKRRLIFITSLLFIIILMPLQAANPKTTNDKNDKVKEKKVKEKKEVTKVKENNGKKVGQIEREEKLNDKIDKIKSDLIYSETLGKDLKEIKNSRIDMPKEDLNINDKIYFEKKDNLYKCLTSLEGLQTRIDEMKKETKIASSGDANNMKSKYVDFEEIKKSFETQNIELLNSLSKEEKVMIKAQSDKIENSNKTLRKLLSNLNKDLEKKNLNNKELFENTKKIEEEVKIIYRQLRAIDWIISN